MPENAQDPQVQHERMKRKVVAAIADPFPFEGQGRQLRLNRIWVDERGFDPNDFSAFKEARLNEQSWSVPVMGDLSLVDAEGKEIDRTKRLRLARLPVPVPRINPDEKAPYAAYLVKGTEYQHSQQERLRPGVYARRTQAGHLEAHTNLAQGMNFAVTLDPERRRLQARFGTANVGLYELLNLLGANDQTLKQAWGEDILTANRAGPEQIQSEAMKLHRVLFRRDHQAGKAPTDYRQIRQDLRHYFLQGTELERETTRRTLGKGFDHVNAELLTRTAGKLLALSRGEEPPDNRNALLFKRVYGPEDLLEFRLKHWQTTGPIANRVRFRLNRDKVRKIVNHETFNKPVEEFFTASTLSNATEQNNPLSLIGESTKTTVLGEGGISGTRAVPEDARNLEPTSVHFHDPVHTPESDRVGISLHTALDTIREEDVFKTAVREVKTNRPRHIGPEEFFDSVVAFADQYAGHKPRSLRVKGMRQGQMGEFSPDEVKYILDRPQGMFDRSTNMIPFLDATQPTRGLTASKQQEQSVPLVDREVPRVQVATGRGGTFEEEVGRQFSVWAPASGTVESVEPGRIVIRDRQGQEHRVSLPDHLPLNQKTFFHAEVQVKPGDAVHRGDLLADSNYTRDGVLALGKNMKVAYMPYYGLNFEDGVVISESAARQFTSEHLHPKEIPIDERSALSLKKFMAHVPGVIDRERAAQLDDEGVIKPGTLVRPGDILVAHLREEAVTPEDTLLARLKKSAARPWKDRSLVWDRDTPGVVTDVAKLGDKVKVLVKTQEPAREGDKIAARHGNKGIITRLVPDRDMPRDSRGDPIDVLMDPHTVPSRINIGQILETAAGKAARKKREVFTVENFAPGNRLEEVERYLEAAGVKDKETVFDPRSGKEIPHILVGDQYLLKLKHTIEDKFGARNIEGHDINRQPKGGKHGAQSLDHLTLYSMLAHDARANVREMTSSIKAEKNDELWLRLQQGMPLPPPRPTFAWEKFTGLMKGMGVNVQQEGNRIGLMPLTDHDVLAMSRGKVSDPTRAITRNDLKPEPGGLFDPDVFGGLKGENWGHIELAEPVPNPILEKGILSLTGLKKKDFEAIVAGEKFVNERGEVVEV